MFTHAKGMEPVASSEGVTVYCPENGKFSFFNSPYHMHAAYSAVDIFCGSGFGCLTPSPVYGEVVEIRRVKCPDKKDFECSSFDYVILLRSLENPNVLVKLLHVEPVVEVGDTVKPGDDLGSFIRSGFFDFWTEPHIHVEVRNPSDSLRARGGFTFESLVTPKNNAAELEKLVGRVVELRDEYSLVALNENLEYGVPVDVDGCVGFLDAGIPHYKTFGVHMCTCPSAGGTVNLCGAKIGVVKSVYAGMCVAHCANINFTLNGKPVRLAFYVHLSKPLLKVIPYRIGELRLEKFEEVSIVIS
jgi:hypothetical protein